MAGYFTDRQMSARWTVEFETIAGDRNKSINADQMIDICKKTGLFTTNVEIEELINDADIDGTGNISFPEFCIALEYLTKKKTETKVLDEPDEVEVSRRLLGALKTIKEISSGGQMVDAHILKQICDQHGVVYEQL